MDQAAAREAQQPAPEQTGCFWHAEECWRAVPEDTIEALRPALQQ